MGFLFSGCWLGPLNPRQNRGDGVSTDLEQFSGRNTPLKKRGKIMAIFRGEGGLFTIIIRPPYAFFFLRRCSADSPDRCRVIPFDLSGNNNDTGVTIDDKSHQWFGATVSSSGEDGVVVVSILYSAELKILD